MAGLLTIPNDSVVVSCLLINFMLSLVDHERSFITSGPDCFNHCIIASRSLSLCHGLV